MDKKTLRAAIAEVQAAKADWDPIAAMGSVGMTGDMLRKLKAYQGALMKNGPLLLDAASELLNDP